LNFGVPFTSLIKMNFPTYNADNLPEHLQSLPAVKPGS
jgi:orotate phosphoribosyltransferase